MFRVIFTCDYEIYGNGEGSVERCLLAPTDRMLSLFDAHGAKLTIMADVAEIFAFKEYWEKTGTDGFRYNAITEQLKRAVATGHDVQLHIHSSYIGSSYSGSRWEQNFENYNLSGLPFERIDRSIREGKRFLESVLQPVRPSYRCIAFRAANWSMSPTRAIATALRNNGFHIDTSVFKHGRRQTDLVSFDYEHAHHELIPWEIDFSDINKHSAGSGLLEMPIYCEARPLIHFLHPIRLYNQIMESVVHPLPIPVPRSGLSPEGAEKNKKKRGILAALRKKHAWKMDFNFCTGRQLIRAMKRIEKNYGQRSEALPVVLIGHSKCFIPGNGLLLVPFLRYVARHRASMAFGTFPDFLAPSDGDGSRNRMTA